MREEKYILVGWPEIQDFMVHPRWNECIFCNEIQGHPCQDSTYAVPESIYNEVMETQGYVNISVEFLEKTIDFISFLKLNKGEEVDLDGIEEKLNNLLEN